MVDTLEKELAKADLIAMKYARGPAGADPFVISIQEMGGGPGVFRTWQGKSEIEVTPNKKLRQAVITASEPERVLSRAIPLSKWDVRSLAHVKPTKVTKDLERTAKDYFGERVVIPETAGLKYNYTLGKISEQSNYDGASSYNVDVKVEATVPATSQSLLVGMDETHYFVAALPEKALTVVEAHEILRPASAKKDGTKRQGEWFFIPVSERLSKELFKHTDQLEYAMLEDGSTHVGSTLIHGKGTYAIGVIQDERKGRHEPLILTSWHQVRRNNEIEVKSQPRTRYWD